LKGEYEEKLAVIFSGSRAIKSQTLLELGMGMGMALGLE
jgi:hypothetical protein